MFFKRIQFQMILELKNISYINTVVAEFIEKLVDFLDIFKKVNIFQQNRASTYNLLLSKMKYIT